MSDNEKPTAHITVEVEMPHMPNFLRFKGRQGSIDIGDLDDDSYGEFENKYIESLRSHWQKRKNNPKK